MKLTDLYTFTLVQSTPFWLLWAEIEFEMYIDLFKWSVNQIKSVQQNRQQALIVYCSNMYTVWQAHSWLGEGCCPKLLILILKLWQEFYPRARNRLWISAYYIHSSRYDWQNWYKSILKENSYLNKFLSSASSMWFVQSYRINQYFLSIKMSNHLSIDQCSKVFP